MKFPVDEIWIDNDAADYRLCAEIAGRSPHSKVLLGSEYEAEARKMELDPNPFKKGKRILKLVKHKGSFVKPCPGTREYVCCNLEILHIGQGCPMDCRYCALQFYFNRPVMEVFVNQDEMLSELSEYIKKSDKPFHRFCTGEFADSLALDPLTNLSSKLVDLFRGQSRASLEMKTKTDSVSALIDCEPAHNVVVSFSMNSMNVNRKEEIGAASISNRLKAASKIDQAGYRTGFHFDPIIPHENWKREYSRTVEQIFDSVSPESIAWFSLGVIRFQPVLKDIVTSRFGPLTYFHDAFNPGLDGKSRIFVDRRIEIYRFMAKSIKSRSPKARIYLCMESPEVWAKSLGMDMTSNEQLAGYLDEAFLGS